MEINQQDKEWIDSSIESGKKYGYPECCINEFISKPPSKLKGNPTIQEILRLKMAFQNGHYTGFIPCLKHAMEIKKELIQLDDLINKTERKTLFDFPSGFEFK
jgi:hypothetical protein